MKRLLPKQGIQMFFSQTLHRDSDLWRNYYSRLWMCEIDVRENHL